jgi:hypothetical protein
MKMFSNIFDEKNEKKTYQNVFVFVVSGDLIFGSVVLLSFQIF